RHTRFDCDWSSDVCSSDLDAFSQLLAAGLTSIFAVQTLIITAGNMKIIPLTGIPLPFLSYGGSSIIANYIIIGILLRISHNTARSEERRVGKECRHRGDVC